MKRSTGFLITETAITLVGLACISQVPGAAAYWAAGALLAGVCAGCLRGLYALAKRLEQGAMPPFQPPVIMGLSDAGQRRAPLRLVTRQDIEAAYGPQFVREMLGGVGLDLPTNPDPPPSPLPERFVVIEPKS